MSVDYYGFFGLLVYRYKGRFLSDFSDRSREYHAGPSGYGLQVLNKIPRDDKELFEEWVRSEKERLDRYYEYLGSKSDTDPDGYELGDEQPKDDLCTPWVYEIDLDHLVFHINCLPLFRLDNMPPDNIFLESISYDHFGHMALDKSTPVQYRYNWHMPAPLLSPESLVAYNSCHNRSSTCSVHELLCIPLELSPIERARTTLTEVLVTGCMATSVYARYIRVLESAPDRDYIQEGVPLLAFSLVNFAVGAPFHSMPPGIIEDPWESIWIRKDVLVYVTTHLDDKDKDALHAAIGELVHKINARQDKQGTIYGIVCSLFHCAIVRVDKDVYGSSFAHTPALQFLPSFYATKISTPGIGALSRLGCQTSGVEFLEVAATEYDLSFIDNKGLLATGSVTTRVPVEVWIDVGQYITSPKDLVTLASISPQARTVAADLARYPCVEGFRLMDIVGPIPPISVRGKVRRFYTQLGCAQFKAVKDGHHMNVQLGQAHRKVFASCQESFEAKTFLYPKTELYYLVLDDDDDGEALKRVCLLQ